MADDLFDVITLLFAVLCFGMGASQLRRSLPSETPFHGGAVPNSRPGSIRVAGWLLIAGGVMFLALCILGVVDTVHLAY